MKRFSFKTILLSLNITSILIFLACSAATLFFAQNKVKTLIAQSADSISLLDSINDVKLVFNQEMITWKSLINLSQKKDKIPPLQEKFNTTVDRIIKQSEMLKSQLTSQELPLVNDFVSQQKNVKEEANKIIENLNSSKEFNLEESDNTLNQINEKCFNLLNKISDQLTDSSQKIQDEGAKKIQNTFIISGLVILLVGFLILVTALFIINFLSKKLNTITDLLRLQAEGVGSTSEQISDAANNVLSSSSDQSVAIEKTSSSITEIKSMAEKSAENAEESRKNANKGQEALTEGRGAIQRMSQAIESIRLSNENIIKNAEKSNAEFEEMLKVISSIESKTSVINDIVFQTKLLSFNASVEAARAGQHGKGFAVVAQEIGNLAQMSGNAATEINGILQKSIEKVNGIVVASQESIKSLITDSRKILENGIKETHACSKSFEEISQMSEILFSRLEEISGGAREQAIGVSEVNNAIHVLSTSIQNNTSSAQQTASIVGVLDEKAAELTKIVQELDLLMNAKTQQTENQSPPTPPEEEKTPEDSSQEEKDILENL